MGINPLAISLFGSKVGLTDLESAINEKLKSELPLIFSRIEVWPINARQPQETYLFSRISFLNYYKSQVEVGGDQL
jgi:hypothetical protein